MTYVYESPDDGDHVYRRKIGQDPNERELLNDADIDEIFMAALEEEASKHEVTVDYYMDEFL